MRASFSLSCSASYRSFEAKREPLLPVETHLARPVRTILPFLVDDGTQPVQGASCLLAFVEGSYLCQKYEHVFVVANHTAAAAATRRSEVDTATQPVQGASCLLAFVVGSYLCQKYEHVFAVAHHTAAAAATRRSEVDEATQPVERASCFLACCGYAFICPPLNPPNEQLWCHFVC